MDDDKYIFKKKMPQLTNQTQVFQKCYLKLSHKGH